MKNIGLVILFGAFVQIQVNSCFCAEGIPQFKFSGGDQPLASFSVSQELLCAGNCVLFLDESESDIAIVEWDWTFQGGQATGETDQGVSSQQNPEVCYQTPGAYWAVLSVTDMNGVTSLPDSILILVDPCTGPLQVNFGASDTSICAGDCIDFQNQSLGSQTNYTWIFGGINQTSAEENPVGICYNTPGNYDVTLIVENGIEPPQVMVKTDFIIVLDATDTTSCPTLTTLNPPFLRNSLHLIPNPAQDKVKIKYEGSQTNTQVLAIYTIDGRLIDTKRLVKDNMTLDLSEHIHGIYILNLLDESGNVIAGSKLILQ